MSATSVITLNKGRRAHLLRLLEGLSRGSAPAECIIVEMGGDTEELPAQPFPVRRVDFAHEGLPLAEARNAGRRAASGGTLVFLDVDCIPSANLVSGLSRAVDTHDGLVCCAIRYLPAGAVADGWLESGLYNLGEEHPARVFPSSDVEQIDNPGLFWSLAFAVRAASFDRLGGFDETYTGYGAEDTDLAFRAAEAGIPLYFAGGMRAFHQHHASCDPPLQHFSDIIANARRFHARHRFWPMSGWLDAFADRGLIAREREADIVLLRSPTPSEILGARLPPERAF